MNEIEDVLRYLISDYFQMEMEFYNFALKHFKWIKKSVGDKRNRGFIYEKVRPRPT